MKKSKKYAARIQSRIISLWLKGMKQSAIAKKLWQNPVYVSRAIKKYREQKKIENMDWDNAVKILNLLNRWEKFLIYRIAVRMKNDAAICLFDRKNQEAVSKVLPFFRSNVRLQQSLYNTLYPPANTKK